MKILRVLLASFGLGKKTDSDTPKQTNLLPVDGYVFENKHHMLEDARHHQLPKVDDRHAKIVSAAKSSNDSSLDTDNLKRELEEIVRLRNEFLERITAIAESTPETWETVKKEGKVVNDALLSALARAERLLGLPVGEG